MEGKVYSDEWKVKSKEGKVCNEEWKIMNGR